MAILFENGKEITQILDALTETHATLEGDRKRKIHKDEFGNRYINRSDSKKVYITSNDLRKFDLYPTR